MNKNSYIDKKIENISELEESTKVKKIFKGLFLLLAIGIIGAPAYIMINNFAFYSGAAMLGCWDILVAALAYSSNQDKKNLILECSKIKEHLQKIKRTGIKSNKEYDQKRLERISKLEENQEQIASKVTGNALLAVIGIIATILSSIGIIFNPQVGSIVAITSLLTTLGATFSSAKNNKEYSELEVRITNLKNDIELGSIFGYDPNQKTTAKNITRQPKKNSKIKALGITKDKEELIDNYIDTLTQTLEDEKNKYLVK